MSSFPFFVVVFVFWRIRTRGRGGDDVLIWIISNTESKRYTSTQNTPERTGFPQRHMPGTWADQANLYLYLQLRLWLWLCICVSMAYKISLELGPIPMPIPNDCLSAAVATFLLLRCIFFYFFIIFGQSNKWKKSNSNNSDENKINKQAKRMQKGSSQITSSFWLNMPDTYLQESYMTLLFCLLFFSASSYYYYLLFLLFFLLLLFS